MTPPRRGALVRMASALAVVVVVTAFGVCSVSFRAADLTAAWAPLPGMPGAFWLYVWRWPVEVVGWLVLVWAATRRLASTGSRAVHAPLLVGALLVAVSVVASLLGGPRLVWGGPVALNDGSPAAWSRSWWWSAAGPVVVTSALLVTCRLARGGARPSAAPRLRTLLEAGALVAIPLVSLAIGAVGLTATAFGVGKALVLTGLPYLLIVGAALAASGGGRTSTVALLAGVLLVVNLSLVWRPASYLMIFAAGCALALAPAARGIEWLTAPRRPVPSVPEGAHADHGART